MTPDLTYNCLFGWLSLLSFRLKTRRIGFWPWFACGNQCWHLKPSKWRHHIEGVSSNTVPKVTPQKPAPATAGSGSETRRIPLHLLQHWKAQVFACPYLRLIFGPGGNISIVTHVHMYRTVYEYIVRTSLTVIDKFWRISLKVTDDIIAKLFVT